MSRHLYKLAEDYKSIEGMLDMDYPEVSRESILETLANIKEDIEDKVENIGKLVLSLKADMEVIKKEEERLSSRRKAMNNNIEWLKTYLLLEMKAVKIKSVKREVITVSIADNPPSLEVLDITQVPKEYLRHIPETWEVNKNDIIAHFKETGEIVPGTEVITYKQHINIR